MEKRTVFGIMLTVLLIGLLTLPFEICRGHALAGGSWHIETVDSAGYVGWYTSIALDSSGHPHISYLSIPGDLKYAYYDGTWHIETVDKTGNVGLHTSIALDSSGHPHISYYDDTNGDLKYAYYAIAPVGGIWVPADKLALLAPYLTLISTAIIAAAASVAYIKHRKKQLTTNTPFSFSRIPSFVFVCFLFLFFC